MVKKAAETIKRSLKKVKKKHVLRGLVLIMGIALIGIIITFFIGNTVSLFTKEELGIVIEPKDKLFQTHYSQSFPLNITFYPENFAWCDASCDYSLKDISTGNFIEKGNATLKHKEILERQYDLTSEIIGDGQKMYLFEVECNNIKSTLCRTDEKKFLESALITLDFDLNNEEKEIKKNMKEHLTVELKKIQEIDSINLQNNALIVNIKQAFIDSTEEKQILTSNDVDDIKNKYNKYKELWNEQAYYQLEKSYKDWDFVYNDLRQEVFDEITKYNDFLNDTEEIISDIMFNQYGILNTRATEIYTELFAIYNEGENIESINNVNKKINILKQELIPIESNYFNESNKRILQLDYLNRKYNYFINNNVSLEFETKKRFYSNDYNTICERIKKTLEEVQKYNIDLLNTTTNASTDTNASTINNVSVLLNQSSLMQEFTSNNFKNLVWENNSNSINEILNINKQKMYMTNKFIIDTSELKCEYVNDVTVVDPFKLKERVNKTIQKISSTYNISLKEHKSVCCAFGDCKECCTPETCQNVYPVLLLHGHSFHEDDKPEQSLKVFSRMQKELEEKGYINAGEINLEFDSEDYAYLGRINHPIAVRGTYYYIKSYNLGIYTVSTQKTDRIENYALRLKEIIDNIKFKTGMDKVNIIAHSMGGLAAREYVDIFGTQSINKLILIATPNHGINQDTEQLCKITGADAECEDLSEGSIFLRRLNAKQKALDIPVFNIIGKGCTMDLTEGDGIVTKESAYLDFAENVYVKGNCTDYLETEMHNKMIDPRVYPEVYEYVTEFLE